MNFKKLKDSCCGSYLEMIHTLDILRPHINGDLTYTYRYITNILNSSYRRSEGKRFNYYL